MKQQATELEELGFTEVGNWILNQDFISLELFPEQSFWGNHPNILYAFVSNGEESIVKYIGKTTRTLKGRFGGYSKPGKSQSTNIRVNKGIKETLEQGITISIYVFNDIVPLQWSGINLNVAAGIEDGMIRHFEPEWNIAGVNRRRLNSLEELESENLVDSEREDNWAFPFKVKLFDSYYFGKQGFMNPGVKASMYLGDHDSSVQLKLGELSLQSMINRTANQNGSVRIHWGPELNDWYQSNFSLGSEVKFEVKPGNVIEYVNEKTV